MKSCGCAPERCLPGSQGPLASARRTRHATGGTEVLRRMRLGRGLKHMHSRESGAQLLSPPRKFVAAAISCTYTRAIPVSVSSDPQKSRGCLVRFSDQGKDSTLRLARFQQDPSWQTSPAHAQLRERELRDYTKGRADRKPCESKNPHTLQYENTPRHYCFRTLLLREPCKMIALVHRLRHQLII